MLSLSLFDDPHLAVDGRRSSLRRKEIALVSYLALQGAGSASREVLATLLWGEKGEANARHSLRQALLVLRRELGDSLIEDPGGLRIDHALVRCDLIDAERALSSPDAPLPAAPDQLLRALDDLGTDHFTQWVTGRRAAYRSRWRSVCVERRDAAIAAARWRDAESYARLLESDQPFDVESVAQLVRTLRRAGAEREAAAVVAAALPRFEANGLDASALQTLARARGAVEKDGDAGRAERARVDLVGRDRELGQLRTHWAEAVRGSGVSVVLTGIDGIGRTRLVEDLARGIPANERRLLWIRGAEPGERVALRVTRALLETRGAGAADPAVFARVREALAAGEPAVAADLRALVAAIAAERPLLLVLDDADLWESDAAAIRSALLAPPPRALVIATTWHALALPRGTHQIGLRGLGESEAVTLVSSLLPVGGPALVTLARHLVQVTDGHPQWMLDLIEHYRTDGTLPAAPGLALDLAALPELPPVDAALRSDVQRRLDALPAAARTTLDRIVSAPARATVRHLIGTTGLDRPELAGALETLVREGFVSARSLPGSRYQPTHPLIARVVRDALHPARLWEERGRTDRPWRFVRWALAAGALLVAGLAWRGGFGAARPAAADVARLVLLEPLTSPAGADSATLPVDEMLATNLARIEGIEIASVPSGGAFATALDARAALRISGSVARRGGAVRLDLRLVDRADGRIRRGIVVEERDLFAAVDQATAELAEALGRRVPASPLSNVSTASLAAFEYFDRGERARAGGDRARAIRWLSEAIAADTLFALARLRLAQAFGDLDKTAAAAQLDTALAGAQRLPERERLLLRASRALIEEDPAREAFADSLVHAWPLDPNGFVIRGQTLAWRGAFLEATGAYRRAIALDVAGLERSEVSCLACDAYEGLITAYLLADSAAAAGQVAREWQERQPDGGRAAAARSVVAQFANDLPTAAEAARRAVELNPTDYYAGVYPAVWAIYEGEPRRALGLLEAEFVHPDPSRRQRATWFAAIAERNAGRSDYAERRLRGFIDSIPAARVGEFATTRMHRAQALLEAGRPRDAALLFDSIAQQNGPVVSPHSIARWRAWMGVLAGDALAAAGDTLALVRRIREVEAWGVQSAYGRDRRLHHHLRGLQLRARGDLEGARRAFEAARWSPTGSYIRSSLELADALVALERPQEALDVLRQASRGTLESVSLYGTRLELHRRFVLAFTAAGLADSAAAHRRWVDRATSSIVR